MCRRYSFFSSAAAAGRGLNARPAAFFNWQPQYNAVPGAWMPVITNEFADVIQFFRWGLTPQWAKDDKMGLGMYNTSIQKIKEKPAFEKIYKYKRCVVLSDGWFVLPHARKTPAKIVSEPGVRVHLPGNGVMCFAGIWDVWGDGLNSFSIITHPATGQWAKLFPEMPLLLNSAQIPVWLYKGPAGNAQNDLLRPPVHTPLQYYGVNQKPLLLGINDPTVLEPYSPPGQQHSLF